MSRPITKGSTDVSTVIRIVDSTDGTPETGVVAATAGLALNYRREGAAAVALTALNDLAALNTAHTDGGIKHIGDGYYRVDPQDAAFATGADGVLITGTATGMVVIGAYHPLIAADLQDATSLGLSRLDATVGSRASQTSVDTIDDLLDTEVAAIIADLATLLARLTATRAGYLDHLGAALAESYAADGATATMPQLLYMILALLAERSIAGDVLTAKKLDGLTAAMTFDLSPAGGPHTAQARAT